MNDAGRFIGKAVERKEDKRFLSGSGQYTDDIVLPRQSYGFFLRSPHAHARVRSIDIAEAEKLPGVSAVRVIAPASTEIQWAGAEIAVVAAAREEVARDAVRKIKVDYEVMPHLVREEDLEKAGSRSRPTGTGSGTEGRASSSRRRR